MATLTMTILTMAGARGLHVHQRLTVATLTMAIPTMTILTMAGARGLNVHQRLASEHFRAGSDRARREVRQ